MKTALGYLIMIGGVWGMAYLTHWQTTPTIHDDWLFFPFLVTFFAVELLGANLANVWDYF